jgi:hypothetical protein
LAPARAGAVLLVVYGALVLAMPGLLPSAPPMDTGGMKM